MRIVEDAGALVAPLLFLLYGVSALTVGLYCFTVFRSSDYVTNPNMPHPWPNQPKVGYSVGQFVAHCAFLVLLPTGFMAIGHSCRLLLKTNGLTHVGRICALAAALLFSSGLTLTVLFWWADAWNSFDWVRWRPKEDQDCFSVGFALSSSVAR